MCARASSRGWVSACRARSSRGWWTLAPRSGKARCWRGWTRPTWRWRSNPPRRSCRRPRPTAIWRRPTWKRFSELFAKGFISAAEQQRHQANYDAAQARYDQAVAGYRNQSNQAAYATLEADADGVVTSVDAEVGQVVSAGQPVVRVAQTAEKEVVVGIPEDQVDALRKSPDVRVKLWADPSRSLPGKVREIAPAADPATRTYTVKITVPNPPPDLKLGMTAVATFVRPGGGADSGGMGVRVPITALLQEQGKNVVWLYDAASQTVKPVPVTVGAPRDNVLLVTGGLSPGQTIVTAGVHLLKAGQHVMPMAAADQPSAQSAITPRR